MTAVPFVYRYYPAVRETRARIAAGEAGAVHLVHGVYLQDWMLDAQDAHWRADPDGRRGFADIGMHWCDLAEFTTGHRITRLCARIKPDSGWESAATLVFETDHGAVGSAVISQVSRGRKNQLRFSLDGDRAAYQFDQENPDALWVGGRAENRIVHCGESARPRKRLGCHRRQPYIRRDTRTVSTRSSPTPTPSLPARIGTGGRRSTTAYGQRESQTRCSARHPPAHG